MSSSSAPILTPVLQPIATAPRDGTYILVAGESGYTSTPLRYQACCWVEGTWRDHAHDHFTDGGSEPLYWMPLPSVPADKEFKHIMGNFTREIVRDRVVKPFVDELSRRRVKPWTAETAPLGGWVRWKDHPSASYLITSVAYGGFRVDARDNEFLDYSYVMDAMECSVDQGKTWKPAGTVREEWV